MNKIKNKFDVEIYNFDELDHFNNIDDVGALCSALDMVVSTKSAVPLISAGVGTLTKIVNWRQSSGIMLYLIQEVHRFKFMKEIHGSHGKKYLT